MAVNLWFFDRPSASGIFNLGSGRAQPFNDVALAVVNTLRARRFARQLHGRFGLPVFEVDERYSTTEALASGAKDVDAASASIILQQFFQEMAT